MAQLKLWEEDRKSWEPIDHNEDFWRTRKVKTTYSLPLLPKKNSKNDPLKVNYISPKKSGFNGWIGMTISPGKKHDGFHASWDRDLDLDLERLRDFYFTDTIVTLIEDFEFSMLNTPDLREKIVECGIDSIHYPIVDMNAPSDPMTFCDLIDDLLLRLEQGENIVIHCRGGLGRTGLLAACLLCANNFSVKDAIALVRARRQGAIQTKKQEDFIQLFADAWEATHVW